MRTYLRYQLLLLMIIVCPTSGLTQTAGASLVQGWKSERDVQSPSGFRVFAKFSLVGLALERYADKQLRNAQYCAGLILPGQDCSPKPSRISSTLSVAMLMVTSSPGGLDATAGMGVAFFDAVWVPLDASFEMNERQRYIPVIAGIGYSLPIWNDRAALRLDGDARWYFSISDPQCTDCARRYEESFGGVTIGLGIAFTSR